jgi:hypothetical protein
MNEKTAGAAPQIPNAATPRRPPADGEGVQVIDRGKGDGGRGEKIRRPRRILKKVPPGLSTGEVPARDPFPDDQGEEPRHGRTRVDGKRGDDGCGFVRKATFKDAVHGGLRAEKVPTSKTRIA